VSAPVLTGSGSAWPATLEQDAVWEGFFARHYAGVRAARRIFAGAGVRRRHAVANPLDEDISGWTTGARMARYVAEALPLGKQAVAGALDDAGLAPGDVGLFAVATCTGYATPGLDIRLAADLGMPAGLQRLLVGHMGCYAALPGLAAVTDFVAARSRPAVLLCCELTSLHVQPAQADLDQVVSHALFSDAAAAVVIEPGARRGHRVAGIVARTDASTADHMTWDVTDLGFRMGLSPRVPDVLARHVGDVVDELLTGAGLRAEDVAGWAVHPGGPRILDVVRDQLGLDETQMAASRTVLAEHGNCSSATVLLVLEELGDVDGPVVAMAFGPGLTLYAALLLPARPLGYRTVP
jgi:predicted naringenin-chalcone synthase